jgi:alkylation response protein AidB-like acyl-CoA dehydrogenase
MTVDHTELRAWLEANCPPEMREPPGEDDICWGGRRFMFRSEPQKLWLERCVARGLTVPAWPKEYGGASFTREDAAILKEEMQRIHARPPLVSFGIWMLGPALLKFGSPEQKATHLPRIARGEIRWCQGYSEPGAGSDLASLRTKTEDRPRRDARGRHVDEKEGNALLLDRLWVGAHEAEDPVDFVGVGGPDLLPVDEKVIATRSLLMRCPHRP